VGFRLRTSELLLLLLLGNLRGLRLDLTGTSQGTVDFTLLRIRKTEKRMLVSASDGILTIASPLIPLLYALPA